MTPDAFVELVRTLGLPLAILIFVLWSGARGWWVFGRVYDDLKDDRDHYRTLAEKGTDLAETAVTQRRPRGRPSRP